MRYEDFVIQVVQGRKRGYTVLASCAKGDGQGRFLPPSEPMAVAFDLNDPKAAASIPEVGERLFESLFPEEVLRLYERCLDGLNGGVDAGLRLKLKLDPREPDLAAFQAFPWELMRQPGTPDFPALSRRRPIVRFLAIPRSIPACPRPERLRILPVATSPRGREPLDLERELRKLKTAVAGANGVVLAEPAAATLEGLRKALSERPCHVLHFMGHGSQGHLWFEAEDRTSTRVTGTDLANVLSDFPSLRLVVLNACHSAREAEDGGARPFGGVATTLVMGGVPAVIAMQQTIDDDLAITFSQALYESLAIGNPVDTAVADVRKAIHESNPGGFEWAIPVLFLRTPEGVLFPEEDIPPPEEGWRWLVPWLAAVILGLAVLTGAWWLRLDFLVDQGRQAYESRDLASAAERFRSALALAPFSAEVHSALAAAEEERGRNEEAESHFRSAVDLRPNDPFHVYNLGSFLNQEERFEEAHKFLRQAVVRRVQSPELLGELGRAAMHRDFLAEAREVLEIAVRSKPESPPLRRLLGEVALRQDKPWEAAGYLRSALDLYPRGDVGRLLTLSLLIQAYDRLGDSKAACRAAGELRLLDPLGLSKGARDAASATARLDCRPSALLPPSAEEVP